MSCVSVDRVWGCLGKGPMRFAPRHPLAQLLHPVCTARVQKSHRGVNLSLFPVFAQRKGSRNQIDQRVTEGCLCPRPEQLLGGGVARRWRQGRSSVRDDGRGSEGRWGVALNGWPNTFPKGSGPGGGRWTHTIGPWDLQQGGELRDGLPGQQAPPRP